MQRKEFLQTCGYACLGMAGFGTILQSCGTTKAVTGEVSGGRITVPLSQFAMTKNGQATYRRYIVVRNEKLNYPVVVYRESAALYNALLLRCTHQQAELNVSGELLTCPAHGSEFNTKGEVLNGPAEAKLRQFRTSADAQNLYIDLS